MRSLPRPFPGVHRLGPLEALAPIEKRIAFCRLLLACATLAVVILDPRQPSFRASLAYLILTTFVAYSALLFMAVRGGTLVTKRLGLHSTLADIAWITVITRFTEAGQGPFFLLHVFVIYSSSVRWGLRPTMAVTLVLASLYPAMLFAVNIGTGDTLAFRHVFRPVYLLILGYLIGYLGEHELRSRRKLAFMLDLPAAFRQRRPRARGLARLVRQGLAHFDAEHAILALRDPDSGRYFTWDVAHRDGRTRLGLRITETNPYPMRFAARTEGFLANDLRPGSGLALCYDVRSGNVTKRALPRGLTLPGAVQTMLVAPVLIQDEVRGHVFVVRELRRKFTQDDLEFLLLLVGQAAAGFENVRLQEKAGEIAVLEERARIARDLHDGFIQSLAGMDLRIEACKLLLDRNPGRVRHELGELHQAVDQGYREVRHYLNVLRTARGSAADLWSTLETLVREFQKHEGVRVFLARPASDPGVPDSTGFELAQIVREALRNAARHGRATRAIVKLGVFRSHLYLVVRDNGGGFANGDGSIDADGFLEPAATPWSIRERTSALGGSLRVWTQSGHGAEVCVTIPADTLCGRFGSDRRMYA